ncbi:MAG: alpha-L-arabinofuranosidase C-terminal domain-containing protein, partial [Bacteroidota bacterium]|nr:alpha-L-arabinofuranosidase C-terminal domain-containing protein [Bacteroidota bacterium]
FYIFKSFSNNCLGNSVDTYVDCDTFNTEKYKGIPYLDVTSVYSKETNTLYVNVVNRQKDKAITADILNASGKISGKAEADIIDCASLNDSFTFDKRDLYLPVTKELKVEKNKLSFSFPAHSFTQIKIVLNK